MNRIVQLAVGVAVATLMAGCSGEGLSRSESAEDDGRLADSSARGYRTERLTDFINLDGTVVGDTGSGLTSVNRFLWRASLDTLAFLPLSSTDPFTGVIATDWAASPDAPNERFKVTAYVKSPDLTARALQIAVFREIRTDTGGWATAPVSGATARQLEDAILVRARQLKIDDRENG